MRVVLDCNIIISAGLNAGICREVITAVVRRHEVLFSADVLQEYLLVAKRKKFSDSYQQLTMLIQILMQNAILVDPAVCGIGLPDANDVMFLDLAISGAADALVTGNKRHFPSSEYAGVRILSPREFLAVQND